MYSAYYQRFWQLIHFDVMRNICKGRIFIILLLSLSSVIVNGKNGESRFSDNRHTGAALGASLSTAGPGLNFILAFGQPLLFRVGFEYLAFSYPFSFEENDIGYDAGLNYRGGNISLLADYYVYRALFVSGGAGFNLFKPRINGTAAEDWKYGDIFIPAKDIGDFVFEVNPSWRLSPYLGLGIGRKISRKGRLAFSLEAGAFYMGPPKLSIEATGLLAPTASDEHRQKEMLESHFSSWRFYPVVKTGLSFLLTK